MDEFILNEFSSYYKRITRVEQYLKNRIVAKYTTIFGDKAYNILFEYFIKLEKIPNAKYKRKFTSIWKSNKTNQEKLINSVNTMYLPEILELFKNKAYTLNAVRKGFFAISVNTIEEEFQNRQKYLKELRNYVAHFNYKKMHKDKKALLKSLVYFEYLLGYRQSFDYQVVNVLDKSKKLATKTILELIYQQNPSYFSDDRLLISLFDDIAIMTGYNSRELPQRWSIGRQKYEMQRQNKKRDKANVEAI